MPGCLDEYDCFFMDQSGYVFITNTYEPFIALSLFAQSLLLSYLLRYLFLKLNEENAVVHLTEKFSWLGKIFVESLKILKVF